MNIPSKKSQAPRVNAPKTAPLWRWHLLLQQPFQQSPGCGKTEIFWRSKRLSAKIQSQQLVRPVTDDARYTGEKGYEPRMQRSRTTTATLAPDTPNNKHGHTPTLTTAPGTPLKAPPPPSYWVLRPAGLPKEAPAPSWAPCSQNTAAADGRQWRGG